MSLLTSHPHIECGGEAFRELKTHSTDQRWNDVFNRRPPWIRHVGFKIFYYHPLDTTDRTVWDMLRSDSDIRVVHLQRRNMLRTVDSRKIADQTDVWDQQTDRGIELEHRRVVLEFDECVEEFDQMERWRAEIAQDFSDHKVYDLWYEHMVEDRSVLMDLQAFLGVEHPRSDLASAYVRQNDEPLSELIINYQDLAAQLLESRWAYLLDMENA